MKYKDKERILIKISDELWAVLEKIKNNSISWSIADLDRNPMAINTMRVEEIDVAEKEYRINCKIAGKWMPIKLSAFIRNFFGEKTFDQEEVDEFITDYNKLIKGTETKKQVGRPISLPRFRFNPLDVRSTFLSLVTETYPHGHEEEVVELITPGLQKDDYGNYYTVIGESDTVFTCHLDTASRTKSIVNLVSYTKDSEEFIVTDGTSILGADDKSGVTILMYMIAKGVPGVYWFFIGEERGGLGSRHVANNIDNYPFMKGKMKCVSFDRRNYFSVITKQMGVDCCSNEFAQQICQQMTANGLKMNLDPTGVFTDSANFIDLIPECTNISVGYFNEHTHQEMQNMTFLEKLCKASVACNWAGMTVHRKMSSDLESFGKYKKLASDLKKSVFYNYDTLTPEDDGFSFELEVSDVDFEHLDTDLYKFQNLLKKNGVDPNKKLSLSQNRIKIQIR